MRVFSIFGLGGICRGIYFHLLHFDISSGCVLGQYFVTLSGQVTLISMGNRKQEIKLIVLNVLLFAAPLVVVTQAAAQQA